MSNKARNVDATAFHSVVSGEIFDGNHTLTESDLEAIRKTIFEQAPIAFMDTQKVIIENKELRDERDRLRGWVSKLLDAKDDHIHHDIRDEPAG
jgi:hypothetical protein